MNDGLIARRYAKALFKVATERHCAPEQYRLMHNLLEAYTLISSAMSNPFAGDDDKRRLLLSASQAGDDATFGDFVSLLTRNGRLADTDDIARAFCDIYRHSRGICRVEVVTAAPLARAEEQRIKDIIAAHIPGKTMEYAARVNADIIGGFIVTIDNERLDASISNELKQLRLNLIK